MITIKIDNKEVDVTECAIKSCGQPPVHDPNVSAQESFKKRKDYYNCVQVMCGGKNAPKKVSLGSITKRPEINSQMGQGGYSNEQDRSSDVDASEESWFAKNRNYVIVGATVVLIGAGVLIYMKRKK